MILFFNVFLTVGTASRYLGGEDYDYRRGLLPNFNAVDIFKYTLASYEPIHWDDVIIYAELDKMYKDREQELENFIHEIFPGCFYNNKRTCRLQDWHIALEKHFSNYDDNQLIWYWGNHDHVFIDYDLEVFNYITDYMNNNPAEYQSLYPTSWPEMLCQCVQSSNNNYEINKNYGFCTFYNSNCDATQIMNKKLLYHWFFNSGINPELHVPRSDGHCSSPTSKCYVPLREICRHFDGYGHNLLLNIAKCPALTIPPNFWDNLKIRCYYDDIKKDYVNINPLKQYSNIDPTGVDFRGMLEDIPLFWRKYIKEIDTNPNISSHLPRQNFIVARNAVYKDIAEAHPVAHKPEQIITWAYRKQ